MVLLKQIFAKKRICYQQLYHNKMLLAPLYYQCHGDFDIQDKIYIYAVWKFGHGWRLMVNPGGGMGFSSREADLCSTFAE